MLRWLGWPLLFALVLGMASAAAQAAGVPLGEASKEQKLEAQDKYLDAKKEFDAGRYEEALAGFRASYDVVASPNSHHMMVRTLKALGRVVDAYAESEITVTEAEAAAADDDKYQQTAVAARSMRDELRGKVAMLTVSVQGASADATLTVDGKTVDPADWGAPHPVAPGKVVVAVEGPEGKAEQTVELAPGGEASVVLEPAPTDGAPAPKPITADGGGDSPGLRIASYVFGGAGIVGFGVFAVAGAMHLGQYSDLRDQCTAGVCPEGVGADIDRGRTFQTLANVGVVVGAVGLTTGFIMFIASQPEVRFEAGGAGNSPTVAVGPGSVSIRGQF